MVRTPQGPRERLGILAVAILAWAAPAAAQEPSRPHANHDAQIKLWGPAGIRVNTWSGNLHLPVELGAVSGRGPRLALVLSYNSGAHAVAAPYGYGWQLSHTVYYTEESNGGVSVVWGDGRIDRFTRRDGAFLPPIGSFDILREHQPGAYLLRTRDGLEHFFDSPAHKHLTAVRDPNGNRLDFAYDAEGRMTAVRDGAGRAARLSYAAGRLAEVIDAAGRTYRLTHNGSGDLVEVADALGVLRRFTYDAQHYLTGVEDPAGFRTAIAYRGGAVASLAAGPFARTFAYDAGRRVTTVTERLPQHDRTTRFSYDALGRIVQVERPKDGGAVRHRFRWSAAGRLLARVDPLGRETTYTYDVRGRPASITDAAGGVATYRYEDTFDRLLSATDAAGRTVSFAYDARGNLVRQTNAAGETATFEVDARGDLVRAVDPLGAATVFTYDAAGNLASLTRPAGESLVFTHDAAGNVLSVTDGAGATVSFRYDVRDRQIAMIDPLGATTTFDYDAAGRLVRRSEPGDRVTEHRYDGLGRLTRTTDALGNATTFGYSPVGELVSLRDAAGRLARFAYDALGRLISRTDPLGGVVRFDYDDAGNLARRSDALGTKTLTYDLLDRLIAVDYPGSEHDARFSYDLAGNRTVESNAAVTVRTAFDAAGRPVQVSVVLPGTRKVFTYAYDAGGRRTSMTDPDGGVTRYAYDPAGRLARLVTPDGLATTFSYDAAGRLAGRELPNGAVAVYERDAAGRLTSLVHRRSDGGVLWSFAYESDAAGDLLRIVDADGGVTTYGYDAAHRLTAASYPDGSSQAYAYDAVGNRLALTEGGLTIESSYDAGDRLLRAGPVTYEWDAGGSLVARQGAAGVTRYAYDPERRLLGVAPPAGGAAAFTYYPDGRRLARIDGQGRTTLFFYDGPNLALETDAGGARVARYTGIGIEEWLSLERNGETLYFHQDGLGSTVGLTDARQDAAAAYAYDAFGRLRQASGAAPNPFLFTGKMKDEASGLYLFRYRAYDPETGRFTTRDPYPGAAADPPSLHAYVYVRNDPVGLVDPLGLFPGGFGGFGGGFGRPLDLFPPGSPPLPPPSVLMRLEDLPPMPFAVTNRNPIGPENNDPLLFKLPPERRYRLEWLFISSGGGTSSSQHFRLQDSVVGNFANPLYNVFTLSGDAAKAPQSGDFHPTIQRCPCPGALANLPPENQSPFGTAGLDLESLLANVMALKGHSQTTTGSGSGACSGCSFGGGGTPPPPSHPPRFALTVSVTGQGQVFAGTRPSLRGCCSRHGGICGCSAAGRIACCDGSLSPSCNCSQIGCPGDCSESYPQGHVVSLNATPDEGWRFLRWTGACSGQPNPCRLRMTSHRTVTAVFRALSSPP